MSDGLISTSISIHAPRGGSDQLDLGPEKIQRNFNPRSPWGERLHDAVLDDVLIAISIHAPRGGSDPGSDHEQRELVAISIHAPRGGSDYELPAGIY